MVQSSLGRPAGPVVMFSILRTANMPKQSRLNQKRKGEATVEYLAKDDVFAIQPFALVACDEELENLSHQYLQQSRVFTWQPFVFGPLLA